MAPWNGPNYMFVYVKNCIFEHMTGNFFSLTAPPSKNSALHWSLSSSKVKVMLKLPLVLYFKAPLTDTPANDFRGLSLS